MDIVKLRPRKYQMKPSSLHTLSLQPHIRVVALHALCERNMNAECSLKKIFFGIALATTVVPVQSNVTYPTASGPDPCWITEYVG